MHVKGLKCIIKMSSFMPFTFNAVNLYVVTINGKPWTGSREVCRALDYSKVTKAVDIVKHHCSQENCAQKCQLTGFISETNPVDWPRDSQEYDFYNSEEGMYELMFSSRQSKAKNIRKHCFNTMFPRIRQQLSDKMVDDLRHEHQHVIEEKYAALALIKDYLQDRDNQIQAITYTNVALQTQRDVFQTQLQQCENTITHLRARYVDHARDSGKDSIIIIARKHTTSPNDKYHDLPYYVSRIQRPKMCVKLRWLNRHFPDHEIIVEIGSPNSIRAFN